jgi:hypothetical protein
MNKIIGIFILISVSLTSFGQSSELVSVNSKMDYDFSEWLFYTADDETISINMRWKFPVPDVTEWDFRIGNATGTIRRKFKDDPSLWELRSTNGEVLTARTVWGNDFREWRITDNSQTVHLKTVWNNHANEWRVTTDKCSEIYLYTDVENDFRDWVLKDKANCMSLNAKIFSTFLAVVHSSLIYK